MSEHNVSPQSSPVLHDPNEADCPANSLDPLLQHHAESFCQCALISKVLRRGVESQQGAGEPGTSGIALISAERQRQIATEGYSLSHDRSHHTPWQFMDAAKAYLSTARGGPKDFATEHWPWGKEFFKPTTLERDLIKAAALIVAALDWLHGDVYKDPTAPPVKGPVDAEAIHTAWAKQLIRNQRRLALNEIDGSLIVDKAERMALIAAALVESVAPTPEPLR